MGQGDEVDLLQQKQKEWHLDNVTYWPSVPQDEFKQLLKQVDVGLFSLSKHHKTHNFPGKLLGYMVESKPMLGSVNGGNDLIELVNDSSAGIVHVNGEDEKLLQSARELLDSEEYRKTLGSNGYQLLSREFSVEAIASQLLSITEGDR
ncbi:putative glycosyltransferase [Vibrio variabilis]|uniref:Glycosyltransferase n=1 Tax=Vibrio variabilis TaxID=990271 RepID=A0ABQ0J7V6_9VIBR|nr:putative glycosyltransferase [Vibrio variabilis]